MNERLFRVVAGLLAQAQGGEDPSSGISRVRAVIKKVIEGEHTVSGKLQALVESLREVVPDEQQRYQAAIKALSATSRLGRQEIIAAVNNQLEELKILEKLLIDALPRGQEEVRAREARKLELRSEIVRLREKIAALEREEKEIAQGMSGRRTETAAIEIAMREVFTDIRAEITAVKEKLETLPAESAGQKPVPDSAIQAAFVGEVPNAGQASGPDLFLRSPSKPNKICALCGAHMSFSITRKIWQCFSCAHEEPENYEAQSKSPEPAGDSIFPEAAEASEPANQVQSKKSEPIKQPIKGTIFPEPALNAGLKQNEEKTEQEPTPEPVGPAELKQKCPMCGGEMDYYAADRKWQCYSCGFEIIRNEVAGKREVQSNLEAQADSEEKKDRSKLLAIPLTEPVFEASPSGKRSPGYWGEIPKKKSSLLKRLTTHTKPCPSCGEKMQRHGSGKGWECNNCGYERRI